ncbi:MAG TPA: hypothetical protein DD638_06410 [Pasteurellaceae bacterium]|nr:hypothetical protein [Pasteurellaceae bacterium]
MPRQSSNAYPNYEKSLLKRQTLGRPKTLTKLKNEIAAYLKIKGNTQQINDIVNLLKGNNIIKNTLEEKITYLK